MIKLKDILSEDIIENASVVDTLLQALPHIKKLGNKPMLIRESGGIRSGAAKITSGPWNKGKIGAVINPASSVYDADLGKLFNNLVAKFSINHIVYAAYESNRHGLFGSEYFLIPTSDYKTVWSPEIRDIYLITTRIPIIQDYMKYTAYKQGTPVVQPTTYEQLAAIIEHVLHKYRPKYDWSGIDTPGDTNM